MTLVEAARGGRPTPLPAPRGGTNGRSRPRPWLHSIPTARTREQRTNAIALQQI
jgi:hypothetical protein